MFVKEWNELARSVHENAKDKGFWDKDRNNGEALCLIHSEISEALEALRSDNAPDKHLSEFLGVEIELADAVIRIMDLAHGRNWRVGEAILAKHEFNKTRQPKHGRQF